MVLRAGQVRFGSRVCNRRQAAGGTFRRSWRDTLNLPENGARMVLRCRPRTRAIAAGGSPRCRDSRGCIFLFEGDLAIAHGRLPSLGGD